MNVQGLGLVDKGTSANCQVKYCFLADFPDCLEKLSPFGWNFLDGLNRSIRSD